MSVAKEAWVQHLASNFLVPSLEVKINRLAYDVLAQNLPLKEALHIAARARAEDVLIAKLVRKDPELDFCHTVADEELLMEHINAFAYQGKKDFIENLRPMKQDPSRYVDLNLAELYFIAYLRSIGASTESDADLILQAFKDTSFAGLSHHSPNGDFFNWDTLTDIQKAAEQDWEDIQSGYDFTLPQMQSLASTWVSVFDSLSLPAGKWAELYNADVDEVQEVLLRNVS